MSKRENKLLRRRMVNAYLSSVISISLVLLLVGAAALLAVNVSGVSRYLKENMKISVIFNQEIRRLGVSAALCQGCARCVA